VCARERVLTPARLRVHAATAGDAMLNFADRDVTTKRQTNNKQRILCYQGTLLFFFFGLKAGDLLSQ